VQSLGLCPSSQVRHVCTSLQCRPVSDEAACSASKDTASVQTLSRICCQGCSCYMLHESCTSASLLAQVTPQSWEGARGQRCSVSPRASICSVTRPCVSGMGLTVCKSCRRAGASLIAIPLPILFRFTWMSHVAVVSASLHLDRFCLRHDGIHYSVVVAGCASQACV
jgi:hypothetical protein